MSAAAAMAGALVNIQLIYVGTDHYLTDFRKPDPGTEELIYIDNPISVFGDLEIEKTQSSWIFIFGTSDSLPGFVVPNKVFEYNIIRA